MDAFMVNKRVLMIAYHYPPMRGSSGIQRTLKFSQYLPLSGWGPVMLSAHPRAYANPGDDQMGDIPASVPVTRAFALDTCLLYTSPSPRDRTRSRMPSSA